MGELISFPSKAKAERELPPLFLCDSLPQLVENAIANNLIVSCDSTVTPAYAEDAENHSLYLVVVELPNGSRVHFEQPGYQLKNFLNGLLLGEFLSKGRVEF